MVRYTKFNWIGKTYSIMIPLIKMEIERFPHMSKKNRSLISKNMEYGSTKNFANVE